MTLGCGTEFAPEITTSILHSREQAIRRLLGHTAWETLNIYYIAPLYRKLCPLSAAILVIRCVGCQQRYFSALHPEIHWSSRTNPLVRVVTNRVFHRDKFDFQKNLNPVSLARQRVAHLPMPRSVRAASNVQSACQNICTRPASVYLYTFVSVCVGVRVSLRVELHLYLASNSASPFGQNQSGETWMGERDFDGASIENWGQVFGRNPCFTTFWSWNLICLFGLQITEIITDANLANPNSPFDIKCS